MASDEDWTLAVKKLIALTESGELTWERCPHPPPRTEDIQGEAFLGVVETRMILVYEYRYRQFVDEERYVWETDVAIEFVNDEVQIQWRWPVTPHNWRLLDAIRSQVAQAPEFLRSFLAGEKSK